MQWLQHLDFTILNAIHQHLTNPFLNAIMPIISTLGNNGYIWILAAIILLILKKYRSGGLMLLSALVIEVISCNVILKPLIHRIRPFDINTAITLLVSSPSDYSFPSGHTGAAFAAATVIYQINKKWGLASFVLALLIAFSRLYLYVHFPTDVAAGMILGILSGLCGIMLAKLIFKKLGVKASD